MRLARCVVGALAGAVVLGAVVAFVPPAGAVGTDAAITLPRPTGPYPTGTTLLHLTDQRRVDPLDPAGRDRELMVQLWYPARPSTAPIAPYAPPLEAAALQAAYLGPDPAPQGAFAGPTNSRTNAPAVPGRHRVVLYEHGLCGARTDNTAASEQLASLGFVVAAIGVTHESPAVEFPGGRVESTSDPAFCAAGDPNDPADVAVLNHLLVTRVADARFVLDQLELVNRRDPDTAHRPLPRGLAGSLDTRHAGMFGHSFGGGTTAAVLAADRRFAAGIDLDGFVIGPVARTGLRTPFLVLSSSYHDEAYDPTWAAFLPRLTGWHRWFRLDDAGHYRFIDLGGSVHKWGLDALRTQDPETWRLVFGDVDDARSQHTTTRVVAAFFQHWLHARPEPILDHPTAHDPGLTDLTGTI
jgi:dienelactone hydrolase